MRSASDTLLYMHAWGNPGSSAQIHSAGLVFFLRVTRRFTVRKTAVCVLVQMGTSST